MKRIIAIIFAALALSASAFAQDARQRTVTTIVGDVLAQLPSQDAATLNAEMKDLAEAAPQSVELLAGMLQAPEKGANNKLEYAISGLTNYACASNDDAIRANVKKGLQNAVAAVLDPTNKAFLQTQLRLLSPENEPAQVADLRTAKELLAEAKKLAKSDRSNDRCESLSLLDKALGAASVKNLVKALKSDDRAYRTMALRYAAKYADPALVSTVLGKYKSLGDEAKVDVLNWLGDNKMEAGYELMLAEFAKGGDIAAAAIEAAGKIGGSKAAAALIGELGGANDAAALKALKSFPKGLTREVEVALSDATGQKLSSLLNLASAKRMGNCAAKVFELAQTSDEALAALKGVVTDKDFSQVAAILDKAPAAKVAAYADALKSSLRTLSAQDKYNKVSEAIKTAANKDRFYYALASSGTDQAVADLVAAYEAGDKAALEGLKTVSNLKACATLLKAAQQGDAPALNHFISLTDQLEKDLDAKSSKFASALAATSDLGIQKTIIQKLAGAPTAQAFNIASSCLDTPGLGKIAALTAKTIAAKSVDDLDANVKKAVLTKAIQVLEADTDADEGYAIKEIKALIDEIQEPCPVAVLSEEEQKLGYEMLFDGTNLDKWVGNKEGYRITNNCIYVTAGYGNGGNLYTEKEYRDFVFRFEFTFVRPGANNGVGVRTPMGVDAAYDGMCEVQILDHDDPIYAKLNEYQVHGSVYGVIPAKRIVHKPLGEWSCEEIRVQGDHVTVTVNGEVILDGDVREACQGHNVAPDGGSRNPYTVDHRNHPGMFNETGHVGFLGHGAGVEIRNVRILDLTPKTNKKRK